jgi:hypothetical protein
LLRDTFCPLNFRVAKNRMAWLAVAGRLALEKLVADRRGVGLRPGPSAPAVGQHGGCRAAGSVQLRNEGAQSPKSVKKGFHALPRLERGPG